MGGIRGASSLQTRASLGELVGEIEASTLQPVAPRLVSEARVNFLGRR